ncbi:alpha-L-rhamnosidase C-terminal domain-containing protein [Bacteroides intestinalis]|uniref:Bacterial alpha-L-rhamnosidase n=1 Tax=Bacteroides intestinalis TaxID=329854 RepID=A0A139LVJ0_9BACE|nr:alpha-L-rhamnosidase C-terminal domain-containing protein [Bacteroides intestinalis]KXT55465.1 bacterial alpha-L-rhamnosidase [Bacteroides intestinalis]
MKNRWIVVLVAISLATCTFAQTWIWYPGDYEIWLGNRMNNRRTERGAFFPPFWKTDSHYVVVEFSKQLNLSEPEEIFIAAEGKYNVKLDGKLQFGMPETLLLPAGTHNLNIKVWNQSTPPAIYVKGKTVNSDATWRVTYEDKEWIDESGKASDTSATIYMDAGCWNFDGATQLPSQFRLMRTLHQPTSRATQPEGGSLYDFGKETFGYLTLKNLSGKGIIDIYYGESPEEAKDKAYCETLDKLQLEAGQVTDLAIRQTSPLSGIENEYTLENSKAFRYVYITHEPGVQIGEVSMQYEYLPEEYRGTFRCNDEELNRIWEVGAYTMHLTTREFFIDGIKRDRWVWSGDAIQSYLMNYYLFFDSESVKRTIWLLRGKDPVTSHSNTIMDYTFYWFLSVYDYYLYSGDRQFVNQLYPRMQTMMDYVLGRTNKNGMVEGMSGDWVFVDWADGYLDKKGELSFEQVLFCRSLETMALCAGLVGDRTNQQKYEKLATTLKAKLETTFWNASKQALVHNSINGVQSDAVTRYANMFSVFFNYLTPEKQQAIKHSVLLNDSILKITTPYMRFYELEALCALGEQETVMQEMKAYWGGMLKEGATSFWEKYNPEESGTQHLSMYGRPYGKSLCHAWGASPIYLLGKYYLGVKPVKEGYKEFSITPVLGGLKWMEGSVPTPNGNIHIHMDRKMIKVRATEGKGYLTIKSCRQPKANIGTVEKIDENTWRLWIDTPEERIVSGLKY